MQIDQYIKSIIAEVYKLKSQHNEEYAKYYSIRGNDKLEGQHKDLYQWQQWYEGVADFHHRQVIKQGEIENVIIEHSDFGRMIANEWSSQFLNEGLTFTIDNDRESEAFNDVIINTHLLYRLNQFGEKYFALGKGATVVRPFKLEADTETNKLIPKDDNKVVIDLLDATRVYPITVEGENTTECAFLRAATNKITIQVHLKDEITNFYTIVEVDGRADTETSYQLDFKTMRVWETTSEEPLFQVWYPAGVDNKHLENLQGKSVIDNCITYIKGYDEALDKFLTEFKNGGKKRYISSELEYIDPNTGQTKHVTLGEEDAYIPPAKMGAAQNNIQEFASTLRSEQFIRGLQFYADNISLAAGLGSDKFSVDATNGRPLQTATAAILKDSKIAKNVIKNELIAEENLKKMAMAIKYVYNECIANNTFTFELANVKIIFEDNIIEDNAEKMKQDREAVTAGLMTKAQYLDKWTDMNEEQATEFLQVNGLLANDFITALQAKAITPLQYVDLVYGANCKDHDAIVNYIEGGQSSLTDVSFKDEADEENTTEEVDA